MRIQPYKNRNSFQKGAKGRELKTKIHFKNVLERDLFAMRKVLLMLQKGAIRWIGEIGRQY